MANERITYKRRTRETLRLTTYGISPEIQCQICGGRMISAERLAFESGDSLREIFRRIEDGSAHFVETDDYRVFVCTEI